MAIADASPRSPRAERARAAIADALLSLIEEGDVQPTANRIAERAGISLRLIYHHFGDLESLYQEAVQRELKRLFDRYVPVSPDLPYAERLAAFAEQRGRLFDWLTPVRRASLVNEHTSPALTEARIAGAALAENELQRVFAAELADIDPARRASTIDALALATGWSAWEALRATGRSLAQATAALACAIDAVLGAAAGRHGSPPG